jgi:hypothetical protein
MLGEGDSAMTGRIPTQRNWFYASISGVLLLVVLTGFSATWFMRPIWGSMQLPAAQRELPWHVHVHAVLMTAWYVLALIQSVLIVKGRARVHRRIGRVAFVLPVLMIVFAVATIVQFARRYYEGGFPMPPEAVPPIVVSDLLTLPLFAVFIGSAFMQRKNPPAHRRLILLASLSFIGPAVARTGLVLLPALQGGPPSPAALGTFSAAATPAFIVAFLVHDWITDRRIHPSTLWGGLALLVGGAAATALGATSMGAAIVRGLVEG